MPFYFFKHFLMPHKKLLTRWHAFLQLNYKTVYHGKAFNNR